MNIKREEIPLEVRSYIVAQAALGIKQIDIVDLVEEFFGLNLTQGGISKIISKYKERRTVKDRPRPGRPNKLTKNQELAIVRAVEKDRILNATQASKDRNLNPPGNFHVSAQTISRTLNKYGLKDSTDVVAQIPQEAEVERYNFPRVEEEKIDWSRIVFSDESDLFPDKQGKLHYRRYAGERLDLDVGMQTRWDSRKVKVWGSISYYGVGTLVRFQDTVTSDNYIEFFKDVLLKDFPLLRGTKTRAGKFIFQHDNAMPHVAIKTLNYLKEQNVNYLLWPSYSPDLSPIENVWGFIKEELYKKNDLLETVDDTWQEIQTIWYYKVNNILKKLYESLPNRMEKVVELHGKRIN